MARIKVAQSDGEIVHFDGSERAVYKVTDGVINVDAAHVAAVLATLPDSQLAVEAPPKKEK